MFTLEEERAAIYQDAITIARSISAAADAKLWAAVTKSVMMRDTYQHRHAEWLAHANKAIDEWNARYADAPERNLGSWYNFTEGKHDADVRKFLKGELA
jgi:hypothetical protein